MFSYFKDNIGTIVLLGLFLIIGAVLGVLCKPDSQGVYITFHYESGAELFALGRNTQSVKSIDVATLSDAEVSVLISKIEALNNTHKLGRRLRNLAKREEGPFRPIPVNLNIHFVDEQNVTGPVAKACRDTPLFGNALVAYEVAPPNASLVTAQGLMNIHAAREQLANCTSQERPLEHYNLWLSKQHVEQWLGASFEQNNILVKARIVLASITI